MTSELENLNSGTQRTRRNIVKMGTILATAALGKVHSAAAEPVICELPIVGPILCSRPLSRRPPSRGGGYNCFLKGTKILTAEGERKIEDLAIGDLLPTMFGGLRPVQCIARYPIKKSDDSKSWVKDALPVRIACSALAPEVPHADLLHYSVP